MTDPTETYHLTPLQVWDEQRSGPFYRPEAFAREGFIHCTDGEDLVLEAGNRYYAGDPRAYCLLTIDRSRLTAPVKYEDPGRRYPHLYGPLNTDAVIAVRAVTRDGDGRFMAIGGGLPGS